MISRLEEFTERIKNIYQKEDQDLILKAAACSQKLHRGQQRASGEPYFIHPLQVAEILLDMQMDAVTLAAAFLHDTLEDTTMNREDLKENFGKDVEALVFGVTKIDIVNSKNKNVAEAETVRKMLFAMTKDIRVILIKLADKLHNMRTLQHKSPDRQKAIAQDTLDIYAPLAARLGISWMKDELEDLSLKFLHPDVYQQIKDYVAQKKGERAAYLERFSKTIREVAEKEGLEVVVESRAKHFFSIYQKLKERNKKLEEIYDLLGIRILCKTMHECYILLGLVHKVWMPIEGRFKDYIAMPKSNRYQSLHTTVMGFDGKLTEIQIRTIEMNETAEYGIAAHWVYKKNTNKKNVNTSDLSIISQLKNLNNVGLTSGDFLDEIKRELLHDSIYVFTPKGDVVQLPKNSTAIDFAYHIHTEVGHHAAAAKADGVIIPLKAPLKNTQVIEIITNPHAKPNVDWLRYVKTGKTRHKIRTWLNHHDENLIIDRNIVARKPGPGLFPPLPVRQEQAKQGQELKTENRDSGQGPEKETTRVGIRVGEERNMMIRFANCCNPSTENEIIGYVSRGRGIIIHRKDCHNLANIPDLHERSIEVEWESVSPQVVKSFRIKAHKSGDLFSLIEGIVKKYKGHLVSGKLEERQADLLAGSFSVELSRFGEFKKILKEIRSISSITAIVEAPENEEEENPY